MKESISYSFLLNTIILFVFVCASIITGIFSYYRAFRANTIIINEIEKYEGFNCESIDSISKKLNSISYNVPFNVKCKDSYGDPCKTDNEENGNYAVVSYNVDVGNDKYVYGDKMDASGLGIIFTKEYQYGVYTYMYIDLPIVSQLVRIPFFSKTNVLHDFRNIRSYYYNKTDSDGNTTVDTLYYDYDFFPNAILKGNIDYDGVCKENNPLCQNKIYAHLLLEGYTSSHLSNNENGKIVSAGIDYSIRDSFRYSIGDADDAQSVLTTGRRKCGFSMDWSKY